MSKLFMGKTKISADQTVQQVSRLLAQAGASNIMQSYGVDREISALAFSIRTSSGDVPFLLPVRVESVFAVLQRERPTRTRDRFADADREQAARVAWRQILRWVEAQLALIDTGMVQPVEVFMPYMALKGGVTLFEHYLDQGLKCLPAPEGRG